MLDDIASAKEYLKQASVPAGQYDRAWVDYEWAMVFEKEGKWQEARNFCIVALEQFTRLGYESGAQKCQALLARLPKPTDHEERKGEDYADEE
jgi:hypothetical protein